MGGANEEESQAKRKVWKRWKGSAWEWAWVRGACSGSQSCVRRLWLHVLRQRRSEHEKHITYETREREAARTAPTPFSPIHPFNKITFASLTRRRRQQRTPPRCRNLSAYVQFPASCTWKKFHSAYNILLFFCNELFSCNYIGDAQLQLVQLETSIRWIIWIDLVSINQLTR
jgi:hypothetical protein